MKIFNKILAFILSAVLILSVSGINFHFHLCGHENKLYADVHFPNGNQEGINCECSADPKSCCQTSETSNEHANTCVDIEKNIKTDGLYQLSQFDFQYQARELQLFTQNITQNETQDLSSAGKFKEKHFYSPPDPVLTSSFLL
jgi:hypothetical protein